MKYTHFVLLILVTTIFYACGTTKPQGDLQEKLNLIKPPKDKEISTTQHSIEVPRQQKEMRAVWITTAYNLDWPRQAMTTPQDAERQKKELRRILDNIKSDGYNTVFFQVRTSLGVCYPSKLEPWAPTVVKEGMMPYFDVTQFALNECHKRGLNFHAWFVTFPLGGRKALRLRTNYSILNRHPSWCILHKGGWYLDPGNPDARAYLADVIAEAVKKYAFDGVHLDYIRYPEDVNTFKDDASYRKEANGKDRNTWRRENITKTIALIRKSIQKNRPHVLLSAAPLGKLRQLSTEKVGRKHGWTAYESVLQDPETWAKNRYVDFLVPMMYYKNELFSPFLDDWLDSAGQYCPIVVGLAPYRIVRDSNPLWSISDITKQITESREKGAGGIAMFRYQYISDSYPSIRFAIRNTFSKPIMVKEFNNTIITDKK